MKLSFQIHHLKFRHPFTISRGTKTHQPTLVVMLEHLGHVGYGEAPAISYYDITVEQMAADLERKRMFVEKFAFTEPERYWHYLHHLFPKNPFLVCALDMAGWDLYGKMKGRPLQSFWMPEVPRSPLTDYTIGIDTVERMAEKLQEQPWPIYKIKLGTDRDIEILQSLRALTSTTLRIDANAAWTAPEALEKIWAFAPLGVEFVEQPLHKEDWDGMKQLLAESPLPLIADESCVAESDVERCAGHFHGINIKLTKCSGLTPALRMIRRARELDLKVMVGSMNESTIGTAAIAHLMPLVDYVDADGPLLLEEDLATGLRFENGSVYTSEGPGLGIQFTGLFTR
jgi:L-alanine-DL-glutamate epimerase-like enolase superfamily enzyme